MSPPSPRPLPLPQAALQKHAEDGVVQATLDANSCGGGGGGGGGGEHALISAASPLCATLPSSGDEGPMVNGGGQSDSYSESMERDPEAEAAEEVSENGPLLGGQTHTDTGTQTYTESRCCAPSSGRGRARGRGGGTKAQ